MSPRAASRIALPFGKNGPLPGEKLHEELWSGDEVVGETVHPKILRLTRPQIDVGWLEEELSELQRLVGGGETLELVSRLGAMVKEPRRESPALQPDTESARSRHG